MKRLHIHFGIHRTGTTSIHHNLLGNAEELERQGYIYPELGVGHRHVKTAWGIISGKLKPDALVSRIHAESEDPDKLIILSSEDFCQLRNAKWLSVLSKEFDLSASLYVKRQDLWLESWYNQHIKWPWSKKFSSSSPEFFLENRGDFYWIDYDWLVPRICEFVDREKLHVGVMERTSVNNTTKDFFQFLGVDESSIIYRKPKNESLTKGQLEIARKLDLIDFKPKGRQKILSSIKKLNIEEDDGSKVIFTPGQRQKILTAFGKGNEKVANKFLGKQKLFEEEIDFSEPVVVPEERVYQEYIPKLLKLVVEG
ncbi:hypothetical protein ACJ7V3_01785 [Halomonas elongata]|uniref:hypothetical protein n=1 Tax=Halomonas elongata TaxID=2746 RepID=UPI0038D36296